MDRELYLNWDCLSHRQLWRIFRMTPAMTWHSFLRVAWKRMVGSPIGYTPFNATMPDLSNQIARSALMPEAEAALVRLGEICPDEGFALIRCHQLLDDQECYLLSEDGLVGIAVVARPGHPVDYTCTSLLLANRTLGTLTAGDAYLERPVNWDDAVAPGPQPATLVRHHRERMKCRRILPMHPADVLGVVVALREEFDRHNIGKGYLVEGE